MRRGGKDVFLKSLLTSLSALLLKISPRFLPILPIPGHSSCKFEGKLFSAAAWLLTGKKRKGWKLTAKYPESREDEPLLNH